VSIDFADHIGRACCVFHNFFREKGGYNFDHTLHAESLVDTPNSVPQQAGRSANYVRDHFAKVKYTGNMIQCTGTGVSNACLGFL
jgi:hypothetical protein